MPDNEQKTNDEIRIGYGRMSFSLHGKENLLTLLVLMALAFPTASTVALSAVLMGWVETPMTKAIDTMTTLAEGLNKQADLLARHDASTKRFRSELNDLIFYQNVLLRVICKKLVEKSPEQAFQCEPRYRGYEEKN